MRESFVKKSANTLFKDKKAKVLNEIVNAKGEVIIWKDTTVKILGKSFKNKGFLEIEYNQIKAMVSPEDLELLKESDTTWPIEADTLDLREHEFNINK